MTGPTPRRRDGRRRWLAPGLVLIVWEIESDGLVDASRTGLAAHDVYTPVVIEENPTVCRAESGVKIEAEKALQYALEGSVGQDGRGASLHRDGSSVQEFREGQRHPPDRGQLESPRLRVMNRMLIPSLVAWLGRFVHELVDGGPSDPVAVRHGPGGGGVDLRDRGVTAHRQAAPTRNRGNHTQSL
jgi:hypothetical protein